MSNRKKKHMIAQPSLPPVAPSSKMAPQKKATLSTVLGWVFMALSLVTFFLPIIGLAFAIASTIFALKAKKTQDAQGRVVSTILLLGCDLLFVAVGLFVTIGMLFVVPIKLF